jgi:glutaredoxin-like YruB-family protein
MSIERFTASTFAEQVEGYQGVAMVEFWAPSCQACHDVDAALEKLAQQFSRKARIGKLNVDEQPQIATRYSITNLPSVAIFRQGQLVHTLIGPAPESVYRQALEEVLQPATSDTHPPGGAPHQVIVFSTPTCPWCLRLKTYLRQRQISFKEIDVSQDPKAAQEMVSRSGQMGVPQMWVDGQVVVGFDRQRVDTLLGLSKVHEGRE